jgi:hypothetical protein
MEWGRIVLILGSDIMDFRKEIRPVKIEANSMKIDQLPLFVRASIAGSATFGHPRRARKDNDPLGANLSVSYEILCFWAEN